jgi:hypothetical protein
MGTDHRSDNDTVLLTDGDAQSAEPATESARADIAAGVDPWAIPPNRIEATPAEPEPEPEPAPVMRVRADQLEPGQVVSAYGTWHEVTAVEPITGVPQVSILWSGGAYTRADADQHYNIADPDTAAQWRGNLARIAAQRRFADQLAELARRYRSGELPPPATTARLTIFVADLADVVAAAEVLGMEPPELTPNGIHANLDPECGPGGLALYFHAARRSEVT